MENTLWKPSKEQVLNSNLACFMAQVNAEHQLDIKHYSELYRWSIEQPDLFWAAVWKYCDIKASHRWETVLKDGEKMPGAKWFDGARLNFAENLLRRRDDHLALVFAGENGDRQVLSYADLYDQVERLASAMRHAGVTVNDRVAGYMPNIPDTVIAMLATTSIGALWSSCSPDFGLQGVLDRFGQIKPKLLFVSDGHRYNGKRFSSLETVKQLVEEIPSIERVIVTPHLDEFVDISSIDKARLFEEFISDDPDPLKFEQLPFDHPIYIMYSSGTTGVPKCIVHGAGGTLIQHLKELVLHTDLRENESILYYTTCGWMMWNWLVSSLAVGATVILYDGSPFYPSPKAMFDLIDENRINVFGTSAKYLSAVEKAKLEPISTHQLGSLRSILSTGSPLSPESFDFVYQKINPDVCLSSISGGTDIISCFALGNPTLPVYHGELQCRGLGMRVEVFDEHGQSVHSEKGELVCTAPFPSMPVCFWNDDDGKKYFHAYFDKYPNVWAHGDYAELSKHDGIIMYGRSDSVLNPGGVRIGTSEIYRQVEALDEVLESIAVGQSWRNDTRIILFVKLRENLKLNEDLIRKIKQHIRKNTSPHHVPAKIIQVTDIPKTISGKIVEKAVTEIIHGKPVKNLDALANPEALEQFKI